jgi:hypothetical protein
MGSEIRISCNGCDVDLTEMIGVGFIGTEYLVCACDNCKAFSRREHQGFFMGEPRPNFRCGNCRKVLRVVAPAINEENGTERVFDECPVCRGRLMFSDTGLLWD